MHIYCLSRNVRECELQSGSVGLYKVMVVMETKNKMKIWMWWRVHCGDRWWTGRRGGSSESLKWQLTVKEKDLRFASINTIDCLRSGGNLVGSPSVSWWKRTVNKDEWTLMFITIHVCIFWHHNHSTLFLTSVHFCLAQNERIFVPAGFSRLPSNFTLIIPITMCAVARFTCALWSITPQNMSVLL